MCGALTTEAVTMSEKYSSIPGLSITFEMECRQEMMTRILKNLYYFGMESFAICPSPDGTKIKRNVRAIAFSFLNPHSIYSETAEKEGPQ